MAQASPFLKDISATRFLAGTVAEAEALLGTPLPSLPPPELEGGREVFIVRFHPHLRTLLIRYLQALLRQIGGEPAPRGGGDGKEQAEYEAALGRLLGSVRAGDRRLGLLNLCWLALSKDVAECLRELESKNPAVKKLKYSLHPLLSSSYRRLDQAAQKDFERADPARAAFLAGPSENCSLVEAIIEDGFAFTEASIGDLDFNWFLATNKRYRLTSDVFFEIYTVLLRETERRLREGDRSLLARVARHLPGLTKEQYQNQAGIVKVMMCTEVMNYLFADAWQTGTKLMASPRVKAEAERRKPGEIMDAFLSLVGGVKRFELISNVRDRIVLMQAWSDQRDLDEKVARGLRLYEFGESAQVVNNAVNATVLFLDLRGFTQTSEGQISERDLTRELYTVFDAFIPHIKRFSGTVDKFLGDGIMVTYGTGHADPLDPLNAVRTAILCQDTLKGLRDKGKTYFRMGVAIHFGRVYLAHFIGDDEKVHGTVIGRNVNLAGRLSSASKKPIDQDEPVIEIDGPMVPATDIAAELQIVPEFAVTIDTSGVLLNEGIAISRDALVQLEAHLPLVHSDGGGALCMEYFDEQLGRRIVITYAGDAKFKGVRSSFPVYSVTFEE